MSQPEIVRLKNSVNERDHAVGSKTAPVTLLEYGNFECIHCGRAYPVIKELQRLLKNDLYFVFRHFPTVQTHPHALRAAEATEAAAVQGKFWEMHDELFTHQQALEDHDLSRYAKRIGLDVVRFEHDMVDSNVQGVVIKGSGHWLMEEALGQVIPQLVSFITKSN
ncbi:MAG TPA: thioredoxin domain-containing protein [Pyrinomonadaceae bacterium]|nr:thioredoxin domain-containing protein [Pyrinomonadaceae bacterium]